MSHSITTSVDWPISAVTTAGQAAGWSNTHVYEDYAGSGTNHTKINAGNNYATGNNQVNIVHDSSASRWKIQDDPTYGTVDDPSHFQIGGTTWSPTATVFVYNGTVVRFGTSTTELGSFTIGGLNGSDANDPGGSSGGGETGTEGTGGGSGIPASLGSTKVSFNFW